MRIKRIVAAMLTLVMIITSIVVCPAPQVKAADADARAAYDSYIKKFVYKENGVYKLKQSGTVWSAAETIEVIIDGYEFFGDEKYKEIVCGLIEWYIGNNGEYWEDNGFNDDVMWAVIMCTRTYMLTGTERYLDYAVNNFEMCYNRAWSEDLGGGLWWRVENNTKNACVNGPGAIAACLLGEATGKEAYFTKAKKIMDWEIKVLLAEDGGVKDSYNIEKKYNNWVATYNQGTFIGAVTMLYLHYGDKEYLDYAKKAAEYATKKFSLNNEDFIEDAVGFKGILARWLRYFIVKCNVDDYSKWYREQAEKAWKNRNSDNLIWTLLGTKTENNIENSSDSLKKKYAGWGCSSGLSWVLNGADLDARQDKEKKRTEAIGLTAAKMAYENVMKEAKATYEKGPDQYLPSTWTEFEDIYLSSTELNDNPTLADLRNAIEPLADKLYGLKARNSAGKKIEMESGVKAAGAKDVEAKDCSGGKYVGYTGGKDKGTVSFIVTADRSGEHMISLKYCTAQNRKLKVTVNGKSYPIECKSVGSWNKPGDAHELKVTMKRGENTIVFEGDGDASTPNLDCFEFKRTNSNDNKKIDEEEQKTAKDDLEKVVAESQELYDLEQSVYTDDSWNAYKSAHDKAKNASNNTSIEDLTKLEENLERSIKVLTKKEDTKSAATRGRFEAEVGERSGNAQVSDGDECSGGKYVGYIGGSENGSIKFKVTTGKAGDYVFGVTYCTKDTRPLVIKANGKEYSASCEKTADWKVPAETPVNVIVKLKKGENEVEFTADGDGPNLDCFTYTWVNSTQNRILDTGHEILAAAVEESGKVYDAGQENYTDDSWEVYKTVYEKAKEVSLDLSVDELLALKEELKEAEEALEEKPPVVEVPDVVEPTLTPELEKAKGALDKAVAEAKTIYDGGVSDYVVDTWNAFAEAYKNAEAKSKITEVEEILKLTVKELESLESALTTAKNGLAKRDLVAEKIAAAREALSKALEEAEKTYKKGQLEYTEESWEAFVDAYEEAKKVEAKENADEEELRDVTDKLTEACDGLEVYVITPEEKALMEAMEKLQEALDAAGDIYENGQLNYTDNSWNVFKAAYKAADDPDEDATAEVIEELIAALENAQEGLKEKPKRQFAPPVNTNTQTPVVQEPVLTSEETTIKNVLGVTAEIAQRIRQITLQQNVSMETLTTTDSYVKGISSDNSVSGSTYLLLQAKAPKQTKNSVKLKWNAYSGADGYLIYGSKSGSAYELLATIGSNTTTSYTQKGLTKGTYYKYLVCAYKLVDNTKVTVAVSKTVLAATTGGKYGTTKSISVKSIKGSLKVGKSKKLSAKVKNTAGKKNTYSKLGYESDNTNVATVSSSGKIKAVGKGTCNIYVYAQNGVCKKVKVKVK